MKKLLAALALTTSMTSAMATDLTVFYNRDIDNKANGAGIGVAKKVSDKISMAVMLDRFTKGADVNSVGLGASYQVFKFGGIEASVSAGLTYLDVEKSANGFASTVGVGLAWPITKNIALVNEVYRLIPENKIKSQETTIVSLGLRTTF